MDDLSVFVLALLTGFAVIGRVPATLHTPLMSGTNAVHGIVLVGAMLMASYADGPGGWLITFVAAAFAGMNVAGGYVVTDRMLAMFRTGGPARQRSGPPGGAGSADGGGQAAGGAPR